jgi:hypothetical protein
MHSKAKRDAINRYSFKRRYALKRMCVDYKGGKCIKCGYDKCLAALEFHHLDPSKKEFRISKCSTSTINLKKLFEELDKCELVCANCHREVEFEEIKLKYENTNIMP